jgi:hypothetical protein
MNFRCLAVLTAIFGLLPVGCGKSFPDAYGVYADTDHGRMALAGQEVRVAGNVMHSFPGLIGPSGMECKSLNEFIVYKKGIDPDSIRLTRLQFVHQLMVRQILGLDWMKVNLWMSNQRVDLDIKAVEERRDIYIVVPRKKLDRGFYELHMGEFGAGPAYDLVVGSAADFPSYEAAISAWEAEFRKKSSALLLRLNLMLNQNDYTNLQDVYRPDGKILNNTELQEFENGSREWLDHSGRIVKSDILGITVSENGQSAQLDVTTTYEKAGLQQESVTIKKIGNEYFVVAIR